jgi:orotidine-5'-phosphate decarboxylase
LAGKLERLDMSMTSFVERFNSLAAARSPFCLGLDPSSESLAAWGLPDNASGLEAYCTTILESAGQSLTLLKPQSAFFERFGSAGIRVLESVITECRANSTLLLLDVKRGDIGSTMEGYAQAYFGEGSPMQVDAMTVTPYLGINALLPVIDKAAAVGGHVFVVVASSNPEGIELQSARLDGVPLYQKLAEDLAGINTTRHPQARPCGAVVGATRSDLPLHFYETLGNTLLLCPGVGQQGASVADLLRLPSPRSIIPTASRAVSAAGKDKAAIRAAIDLLQEQAMQLWLRNATD